jgi:prepilin-type N-terminal cleavage/methylation domain-containing protein
MPSRTDRPGFTLVELLVVISILMILAVLVWAVFKPSNTDRLRSAARIAQSAVLGAKDRALHAKDLRGVRLIRDTTDPTLAPGFVYVQPLPMLSYPAGSFRLDRLDVNPHDNVPDSADIMIVRGNSAPATPAVDWDAKTQFFANPGRIRIPTGTGQWYTFTWSPTGSYPLSAANEVLQLVTPFVQQPTDPVYAYPASMTGWLPSSPFSSCDIQLGNDVLPFHQPISLPSGIVIDLKYCSANIQTLAGIGGTTTPVVDIMFSPRGGVSGYLSALGPLHFLLRDLKSATAGVDATNLAAVQAANADLLVLTIFPQTGLVQVFEVDPTDVRDNTSGAAGSDGLADDLFAFARQGKSAGR